MKNMKIKVENNLDEIVTELERLGYAKDTTLNDCACYVYTFEDGSYFIYMGNHDNNNLTTLSELRSMTIETLKEM